MWAVKKAWTFPTFESGGAGQLRQRCHKMPVWWMRGNRTLAESAYPILRVAGWERGMREGVDPAAELVRFRPGPVKITNTPIVVLCSRRKSPQVFLRGLPNNEILRVRAWSTMRGWCNRPCSCEARSLVPSSRTNLSTPVHHTHPSRRPVTARPAAPSPDFPVLATPPNAATSTSPRVYALILHHLWFAALPVWASVGEVRCSALTAWTSALIVWPKPSSRR